MPVVLGGASVRRGRWRDDRGVTHDQAFPGSVTTLCEFYDRTEDRYQARNFQSIPMHLSDVRLTTCLACLAVQRNVDARLMRRR